MQRPAINRDELSVSNRAIKACETGKNAVRLGECSEMRVERQGKKVRESGMDQSMNSNLFKCNGNILSR